VKLRILFLCFLAMPTTALANQVTLSWTNATENTDSTPIESTGPTALVSTTIEWSACDPETSMVQVPLQEVLVSASVTTYTITTGSGTFCFRAKHINEAGESSDWSNVAVKTVNATSLPPGDLVAQAVTVYSVAKLTDGFLLLAVGRVPVGTGCDKTQSVNGRYVVPTSEVEWDTSNRAPVVVADCD
jgi:hypothetical protein